MKALMWIVAVCFCLLPTISFAGGSSYEWVLKQYDAKNESVLNSVEGQLDSEQFLAVIAKREVGPLLAVFRRDTKGYVGVGQMDLPESPPSMPTVAIAKNSIFVETSFCHHGCTDTKYQFKKVDGLLRLIGIESQSDTWCSYFDEKYAPPNCNYSVRSGNSYNLLSSITICWAEIESEDETPSKLPKQFDESGWFRRQNH